MFSDFAEGRETRLHERSIQSACGGIVSSLLRHGTSDIHMPAQHGFFQRGAQGAFECVEIRFEMKVRIQSFVIDTLESDSDFALRRGPLDTGEAGHAANRRAHGFTSGSGSRYCRSCSRW